MFYYYSLVGEQFIFTPSVDQIPSSFDLFTSYTCFGIGILWTTVKTSLLSDVITKPLIWSQPSALGKCVSLHSRGRLAASHHTAPLSRTSGWRCDRCLASARRAETTSAHSDKASPAAAPEDFSSGANKTLNRHSVPRSSVSNRLCLHSCRPSARQEKSTFPTPFYSRCRCLSA